MGLERSYLAFYVSRHAACDHVTILGCRDSDIGRGVNAGSNPIVKFLQAKLTASPLFTGRAEYLSPYIPGHLNRELSLWERQINFNHGGNGLVLVVADLSSEFQLLQSTKKPTTTSITFSGRDISWRTSRSRFTPNWTSLYQFRPDRLELAGIRFVITRQENRQALGATPIAFEWANYVVAELVDANTRGYGVTQILSAPTIADELILMRQGDFNPRQAAVLSEADRLQLQKGELAAVAESEITTHRQIVHLKARSAGKASLIVLPFRYSHCWTAHWQGPAGMLVRADEALLAVYFEDDADVSLDWRGGYGAYARCLAEDASLIAEARAAAKRLPY